MAGVTDLLDWIAQAGYTGIEITNYMIGEFAARPQEFAQELRARNLSLAAFAYSASDGFSDPALLGCRHRRGATRDRLPARVPPRRAWGWAVRPTPFAHARRWIRPSASTMR